MKCLFSLRFLFVLSCIITLFACSSKSPIEMIQGKWNFMQFDFAGELEDVPKKSQEEANAVNKGLSITFANDNHYMVNQRGGAFDKDQGNYEVLNGDKLVMDADTFTIKRLDEDFLELFRDENSPTVFFQRGKQ